jgi:predicted RNA-binding Zn-ribbon protein involved in translation (DUF1610 family)
MIRTYEDHLRERGKVTTDFFTCPSCGKENLAAFTIVERAKNDWVCSDCFLREVEASRPAVSLPPWETETANHVRAVRIQLQERWRWAVMPDSPLNQAAQARVMRFLKLLNTLTIDYTSPEDVIWPVDPTLNGDDYDPDA